MKMTIDVSIYPPTRWCGWFKIKTHGRKYIDIETDYKTAKKLLDKMLGIEPEILESTIAIHGWIPGPEKR